MLEKNLEELGLGDKEAAVYVALLAVDHASVLDLAKKTKIKRPTVYVALDSLEKKRACFRNPNREESTLSGGASGAT